MIIDATNYTGKPQSGALSPCKSVYQGEIWGDAWPNAGQTGELPDETRLKSIASAWPTDRITWLNIEHRPLNNTFNSRTDSEIKTNIAWMIQILEWCKEANPSLALGIYSGLFQDEGGSIGAVDSKIATDDARIVSEGILDVVDFVAPSFYDRYDTDMGQWGRRAHRMLSRIRAATDLPIYPFLWDHYHDAHSNSDLRLQPLDPIYYSKQVGLCLNIADGAILWSHPTGWTLDDDAWLSRIESIEHQHRTGSLLT